MKHKAATLRKRSLEQMMPYLLIIGGIIGMLAAIILSIDKFKVLKDPDFTPICSINPVISCVSVASTHQAEAFGFPNMFIGIAAFAMVLTAGMGLLAGATYKRWYWLALNAGAVFGVVFIHWLAYQSVYNINALCIYCMVVWSVTMPLFWYITLYNLRTGNLPTPPRLKGFVAFIQRHHGDILGIWFIVMIFLILKHFWYYFGTLL